ncbi:MAG TPA: hypothetical protein VIU16_02980 [Gaiellaceae bacterium]
MRYVLDFGSANAGGAPVFTLFVRLDTLAALGQPAIVEISGGQYYFDWPWENSPASSVAFKAELAGVELADVISGRLTTRASDWVPQGAGITLADAIPLLQWKVLEKTGSAVCDDTKAGYALKEANRTIWKKGVAQNPARFRVRTGDVVLSAAAGKLLLTDVIATAGLVAEDIASIDFVEIRGSDGRYYPAWPTEDGGGDRFLHEPSYGSAPDARYAYQWYIEGDALRLTPVPGTDLTLRLVVVPMIVDPADDEPLLLGKYAQHHDLVITKAAQLVYATDEERVTSWDREYKELLDAFLLDLVRGGQGMRSRRVSPRDPFNS